MNFKPLAPQHCSILLVWQFNEGKKGFFIVALTEAFWEFWALNNCILDALDKCLQFFSHTLNGRILFSIILWLFFLLDVESDTTDKNIKYYPLSFIKHLDCFYIAWQFFFSTSIYIYELFIFYRKVNNHFISAFLT